MSYSNMIITPSKPDEEQLVKKHDDVSQSDSTDHQKKQKDTLKLKSEPMNKHECAWCRNGIKENQTTYIFYDRTFCCRRCRLKVMAAEMNRQEHGNKQRGPT